MRYENTVRPSVKQYKLIAILFVWVCVCVCLFECVFYWWVRCLVSSEISLAQYLFAASEWPAVQDWELCQRQHSVSGRPQVQRKGECKTFANKNSQKSLTNSITLFTANTCLSILCLLQQVCESVPPQKNLAQAASDQLSISTMCIHGLCLLLIVFLWFYLLLSVLCPELPEFYLWLGDVFHSDLTLCGWLGFHYLSCCLCICCLPEAFLPKIILCSLKKCIHMPLLCHFDLGVKWAFYHIVYTLVIEEHQKKITQLQAL